MLMECKHSQISAIRCWKLEKIESCKTKFLASQTYLKFEAAMTRSKFSDTQLTYGFFNKQAR